jgi:hypothetical protein
VKQTTCAAAGTRLLSVAVLGIVASVVAIKLAVGSYKIVAALVGTGAGSLDGSFRSRERVASTTSKRTWALSM